MTCTTSISGYDDGEVAVIIPYYQQDGGILARALASVFRQQDCPPVRVIVVDDASPAPPEPELAGLGAEARARVKIVKQPNLGPGQARNAGLATVPDSVTFVAFLDSDDVWRDGHLSRAIAALSSGLDFYFADSDAEGATAGHFDALPFDVSAHECIDHSQQIYRFRGDFLDTLLRRTPVVTSAVVLRRDRLGLVRFPPWRGLCEDLLYWLKVAVTGPNVGFSAATGVTVGREGVHISHKGEWNNDKALTMATDYIRYYRHVLETIPLSGTQRAHILERARGKRIEFLLVAGSMLKAGRVPSPLRVGLFLLRNPGAAWEFASDICFRPRPS